MCRLWWNITFLVRVRENVLNPRPFKRLKQTGKIRKIYQALLTIIFKLWVLPRGSNTRHGCNLSCCTLWLPLWTLWSLWSHSQPSGATFRHLHNNYAGVYGWFWVGSQQLHRAHQGLVTASPRQTPSPRAVHQMKRLWSTAQHLSYHALAPAAAETEPNCRAHSPTRWSLSSAQSRKRPIAWCWGPFWPGRFLVEPDDSAINESIFRVRVFTHCFEKTLEYTRLGPPAIPPELAVQMAGGKSRHGEPVRTRHKTAGRNRRLSFAVAPESLNLPERSDPNRCNKTSDTTNRC